MKLEQHKISVIIPVYNTELYLRRCMDSVINNTYRNLEIICVNDGSFDYCLEILNDYAELDSRVIVIDKPNGGVSSARNVGLAAATGDYIALLDSDDWVHKSYFEVLMHYAEQYNADITVCDHTRTSEQTDAVPVDYDNIHNYTISGMKMLENDPVTHGYVWARLYKHSAVKNHSFSKLKVLEDATFNFDVLASNEKISCAVCDAKLYNYYRRPGSLMSEFSGEYNRQAAEYYYTRFVQSGTAWQRYIYAIEILKNSINYRYSITFHIDREDLNGNNQVIMKEALAEIHSSPLSTHTIRIVYALLVQIPFLYRAFRIITDPSMIDWERKQKTEQKTAPIHNIA